MQEIKLNSQDLDQGLQTLDHWTLDAHKDNIQKEWVFDRFKTAMNFLMQVGEIAERHNHHPEFLATYTKVRIRLTTHDAGGLTHKDIQLATDIDRLIKTDFLNLLKTK